jgi:hypothetical protein
MLTSFRRLRGIMAAFFVALALSAVAPASALAQARGNNNGAQEPANGAQPPANGEQKPTPADDLKRLVGKSRRSWKSCRSARRT